MINYIDLKKHEYALTLIQNILGLTHSRKSYSLLTTQYN